MSAKIKKHRQTYSYARPKNVKPRQFSQVYWPYLPIIAAVCGLANYGISHGNFNYALQYGVRNQIYDPQLAAIPVTSQLAAIAIWSVMFAAVGTLFLKHFRQLKRGFVKGERFIIHHPAYDAGLILVIGLGILISQTTSYAFPT